MKKAFLTRFSLVWLLVLATTAASIARAGLGHQPGPDRPVRREVRAYVLANVLPVLRQQRQKLETQLAPADQAQLVTYRAQLKDVRAQGNALKASMQAGKATPGTRPTLTEAQQTQAQALRLQGKTIMLSVAQIALKYEANLKQLAQEIEPQKTQWTSEIKAIVAKNTTPDQQAKLSRWQGFAARHGGLRKLFSPAAFLLLDPAAPAATGAGSGGTSLYPNPAAATTQLQYEVKKAGPVTVDLLDGSGATLRALLPATQQAPGTYTQPLDLSDLPRGTYFYKITTKAGTETKRFVKE